jgi:trans-2,3-dihydro-3-hydroxyanthranilate isomerase
MKLGFRLLNVFALPGQPLTGNPLCVFEDGSGLTDATMQALALQFNLSETTFILPSDKATARVRIFTPAMELPFAGHPTLGTAQVVRALRVAGGAGDAITLETQAGVIPVSAQGNAWTLTANAPTTRPLDTARIAELAAALGLGADGFAAAPLWVNTGMEQLVVPLASRALVGSLTPTAGISAFANNLGKVSVYCISPVAEPEMDVRFFFSKNQGSVAEDPATGSACANLGGYLIATQAALPANRVLHQGAAVGRPSILQLAVSAEGSITVGGEVVDIGGGMISL